MIFTYFYNIYMHLMNLNKNLLMTVELNEPKLKIIKKGHGLQEG